MPTPHEIVPEWKRKWRIGRDVIAGKLPRDAIEPLTAEELAARNAHLKEERAISSAKTKARHARNRSLCGMAYAGAGVDEMAAAHHMSVNSVYRYLSRWGIPTCWRAGVRAIPAPMKLGAIETLDALAADMGVRRATALERLLAAALADGETARWLIGVDKGRKAA